MYMYSNYRNTQGCGGKFKQIFVKDLLGLTNSSIPFKDILVTYITINHSPSQRVAARVQFKCIIIMWQ